MTGRITYFDAIASLGSGYMHPGGKASTRQLLSALQISKEDVILDAGCGTGQTACNIASRFGCKVIGVDLSRAMISKARERAKRQRMQNNVTFIETNIHTLPFPRETFDHIILESVLVYVKKDQALNEIRRVLKTGSKLCALEFVWIKPPYPGLEDKTSEILDAKIEPLLKEEWRELFRSSDFVVISMYSRPFLMSAGYQLKKLVSQGKNSIRILLKMILQPEIVLKVLSVKQHFQENKEYFGYGLFVCEK